MSLKYLTEKIYARLLLLLYMEKEDIRELSEKSLTTKYLVKLMHLVCQDLALVGYCAGWAAKFRCAVNWSQHAVLLT